MKVLAVALVALACAGCSRAESEKASAVEGARASIYRFRIGTLDAAALQDGDIFVANDGKTFGVGQPIDTVAALLASAQLPSERIRLSIQPLLVRDGSRVLLFDTGAGDAPYAQAGRLPEALRAASIAPSEITDVFISHGHFDHVGGLLTRAGTPAFPNARIHVSAPEWEAMKADRDQAVLVSVVAPQVEPFAPNATLLPSVTAVEIRGHTPGHSAYLIGSGPDRLLYIGDAAHHSVVSVQRPEWTIAWDDGSTVAQASRQALLEHASREGLRLYSPHFPFPGLGGVRLNAGTFVWVPVAPGADPSN